MLTYDVVLAAAANKEEAWRRQQTSGAALRQTPRADGEYEAWF